MQRERAPEKPLEGNSNVTCSLQVSPTFSKATALQVLKAAVFPAASLRVCLWICYFSWVSLCDAGSSNSISPHSFT